MTAIKSNPFHNRQILLESCFAEIPQKVGTHTLRPLSAASFSLLGRLGSPMMSASPNVDMIGLFEAVVLYIWIHAADLDQVAAIETTDDLPHPEIKRMGFQIEFGEALGFLEIYKRCSARMTAALAEVEDDEDTPGKRGTPPAPVGSPRSFTPLAAVPTPLASATSSGSCPSSEPSPISMPPMSQMEPAASGLVPLPELTPRDSTMPQ